MKLPNTRILITALVILAILAVLSVTTKEGFAGAATNAPTFTMYYADWCPHCKTVKPAFADFSKNGSVNVKGKTVFVSMVEEKENTNKKIRGFPTFVLEKSTGESVEFDGERTPEGWKQWLGENL
jgi:thiol-disulfide isomerase/thioredoxin